MPMTVRGKGINWASRADEVATLAKGQLRYIAIEAGHILRREVEAAGLVDQGTLAAKIGQARKVDDYHWVVPSFSDVGDPREPAPRGTIKEFLEWYRGTYREEQRFGKEQERRHERYWRRKERVPKPRTKIRQGRVREVVSGARDVGQMTQKEAAAALNRFRRTQTMPGLPARLSHGMAQNAMARTGEEMLFPSHISRIEAYMRRLERITTRSARQTSWLNAFRARWPRTYKSIMGAEIAKGTDILSEITRRQAPVTAELESLRAFMRKARKEKRIAIAEAVKLKKPKGPR